MRVEWTEHADEFLRIRAELVALAPNLDPGLIDQVAAIILDNTCR